MTFGSRDIDPWLEAFVAESNRIEGIKRRPLPPEIAAHEAVIAYAVADQDLPLRALLDFVTLVQPDARLRDLPGLDVRVGNHIAPKGGPAIRDGLQLILQSANDAQHPWHVHVAYETLHPFTDGNGRSGRVLWLYMMMRRRDSHYVLGFLHAFYYQTLEQMEKPC